jgi:hypothetical protein
MQFWLQNYDKRLLQSIEAGWTVDRSLNNGDAGSAYVFTFYMTDGYTQGGNNLGGYNRVVNGWVQYSSTVFPGIRINGYSKVGGPQVDISIKAQLYEGNWWIAVQGAWMGYYPCWLFNGGICNRVEWVTFGGELFSSLSNPCFTKDEMGSGLQAQDGWAKAAFARNLRVQTDTVGTMLNDNGTGYADSANKCSPDPYDIQTHMNSGTNWGSYFYVGGPTA